MSIAVGLRWRGTRYAAVWVAVAFHLATEVSASVQVFSYLAIGVLVIWAVPSTRDRALRIDPTAGRHRRWCAFVRGLDWLARFRIEPAPFGSRLEVEDRDAPQSAGRPLTAWFALPAPLIPAVRRGRRAGSDRITASVAASGPLSGR